MFIKVCDNAHSSKLEHKSCAEFPHGGSIGQKVWTGLNQDYWAGSYNTGQTLPRPGVSKHGPQWVLTAEVISSQQAIPAVAFIKQSCPLNSDHHN